MRKRLGEYGRARVLEHLAWPHEAPKLLEAYETLFVQGLAEDARPRNKRLVRRLWDPLISKKWSW